MKITKKKYLQGFFVLVMVLALVRCIFPSVAAERKGSDALAQADSTDKHKDEFADKGEATLLLEKAEAMVGIDTKQMADGTTSADTDGRKARFAGFFDAKGKPTKTLIYSVPSYAKCFPDSQHVHEVSAKQWGVKAVANRNEAEHRKGELVYVGSSPYYKIDPLKSSIPYLVPRASLLLHDIGMNFYDSLQHKGIPLHRMIVTSVLRTKEDVTKLRGRNGNATENSCHLYGTTFDICYNRYQTVEAPGEHRRQVRNDSLKYVLAEVLRDMREDGRCHIKYEVKQGCFHITVR